MKTIKVSEATELQLDWLVARIEGDELPKSGGKGLSYSSDWAQGGPIIDLMVREGLRLMGYKSLPTDPTRCQAQLGSLVTGGPTPLIATMRCYVTSKLGDTAEVPEELT